MINMKYQSENNYWGTLTIGMPVYNDPEGVKKSVSTVFDQTWKGDKQLLIIDDGSTDITPAVIKELQAKYQGIIQYRNKKNLGRPYSRNRVLEYAQGKILAWIDAGDIWFPQKLELQFQALEKHYSDPQPLICTCPFQWSWIDKGKTDKLMVPAIEGDQLYNAIKGTLFPYLWTMLGTLESFRSVGGFDENLPRRQDFDFLIRFLDGGGKIIAPEINKPLCLYMKTDVGRSGKDVTSSNNIIWRKHKAIYKRYGWNFALKIRRRQFLLSARYFKANNNHFYWLKYKLLEKMIALYTNRIFVKMVSSLKRAACRK